MMTRAKIKMMEKLRTLMTMNMMTIMMIMLMLDDDNAQKSSITMTLWSKYTPFKYYYLVKKKDQNNRAGVAPPPP